MPDATGPNIKEKIPEAFNNNVYLTAYVYGKIHAIADITTSNIPVCVK